MGGVCMVVWRRVAQSLADRREATPTHRRPRAYIAEVLTPLTVLTLVGVLTVITCSRSSQFSVISVIL